MEIGGWLRGLGLGQYEAAFRENEIDADVLSDLTEIDLEKLGLPLGHRKRLLKAIANLIISFPADRQTPPAWLTLTGTLMICYATIVAFGLLRAVQAVEVIDDRFGHQIILSSRCHQQP